MAKITKQIAESRAECFQAASDTLCLGMDDPSDNEQAPYAAAVIYRLALKWSKIASELPATPQQGEQ